MEYFVKEKPSFGFQRGRVIQQDGMGNVIDIGLSKDLKYAIFASDNSNVTFVNLKTRFLKPDDFSIMANHKNAVKQLGHMKLKDSKDHYILTFGTSDTIIWKTA